MGRETWYFLFSARLTNRISSAVLPLWRTTTVAPVLLQLTWLFAECKKISIFVLISTTAEEQPVLLHFLWRQLALTTTIHSTIFQTVKSELKYKKLLLDRTAKSLYEMNGYTKLSKKQLLTIKLIWNGNQVLLSSSTVFIGDKYWREYL